MYLSKNFVEDSMFPFKFKGSTYVKISFKSDDDKLHIEKWEEPELTEA